MIDAHCHLDFPRFDEDRDELIARAQEIGITGFICAGVEPAFWERQAALETAHPEVRAAFGIHPHVASRCSTAQLEEGMAALAQRVGFAVGETGLDGSKYCPRGSLPAQREAFRAQLALARERNLPVILHILASHGFALDVLQRDGVPTAGGMVHSYSGSAEMVGRYEALGLYISFSGSITRPTARKVLDAVRAVSNDRLLVETDCPDQRPHQREGSRNLPQWLTDVVHRVADVRQESFDTVAARTHRNACTLFGLDV